MISHDKQEELYRFVASRFGMNDKPRLHLTGLFTTGGCNGQAVIEAGYNIGYVARQLTDGEMPDGDALEAVYEKLSAPFANYQPVGHDSYWEEDAYHANALHILRVHKELIFRIARELWDLFPEIHQRFGEHAPGMEPATFFREHMGGFAFQWVELDRGKK